MLLPKDLPMLHAMASGNYIRPNKKLLSSSLYTAMVQCNTIPDEWPPRTDHVLIVTMISMASRFKWKHPRPTTGRQTGKLLGAGAALRIKELEVGEIINAPSEFNAWLDRLMQVLLEVIDEKILKMRPSPYQKNGGQRS